MNEHAVFKTCELLHATHARPIAIFGEDGEPQRIFSSFPGFAPVFEAISRRAGEENVSLVSGVAGLYGAVRLRENKLLVVTGPFVNKPLDDAVFDALIHDYGLLWEQKDALKQFLLSLPRRSLNVFLNFLALLDFLFNGEEISILRYFENFAPAIRQEMGEKHTDAILREEEFTHGTYAIEQQLLSYVSAGDETGLKAFLQEIAGKQVLFEGKLADDTLRQSKNIFNGWISMVGKVGAIRGNLDIEQTYRLIDLYTQECERCTTVSEVNNLRYSSLMDFTRRVAELKHPAAYSEDVYKALQFIKTHTNQPIGVPDVLEYVSKSRSYFMEQFKKETGETIGKYIVKAKLQEAKQLLAYSDRPLSEISNFFFFSSQSYFQNLFKKQFGVTPLEYRRKHHKE